MTNRVLVISGPPGVGKTTVAWRVFDSLTSSGANPGLIDLDLMGAAWPAPEDDPHQSRLKAKNTAAVWTNYAAGGTKSLVIAGVVETVADRDLLSEAVAAPVTVCRLTSSVETLSHRIVKRGRDHGPGLKKLVSRAAELQAQFERSDIADFVVETTNRAVDDVGVDVLLRWHGRGTPHPTR